MSCCGVELVACRSCDWAAPESLGRECTRELEAKLSSSTSIDFEPPSSAVVGAGVVLTVEAVSGRGDMVVEREGVAEVGSDAGSSSTMASGGAFNWDVWALSVALWESTAALGSRATMAPSGATELEAPQDLGGDRVTASSGQVEKLWERGDSGPGGGSDDGVGMAVIVVAYVKGRNRRAAVGREVYSEEDD